MVDDWENESKTLNPLINGLLIIIKKVDQVDQFYMIMMI
jgi:hypothetical protein